MKDEVRDPGCASGTLQDPSAQTLSYREYAISMPQSNEHLSLGDMVWTSGNEGNVPSLRVSRAKMIVQYQ